MCFFYILTVGDYCLERYANMAVTEKTKKMVKCKFCGCEVTEDKIIYGKSKKLTICPECLDVCNHIHKDKDCMEQNKDIEIPKPMELKAKLDEYIVGQDTAKKVISVAVYNHYKRVFKLKDTMVQKSNICLIGSSGSGKTLLAKTIAKLLNVPIVIADCNTFTQAGYVGRNVEDCLVSLVKEADGNIKRAEHGIVFLDEVDKLAGFESERSRDVGGVGVQQSLLKIIEGSTVHLPSSIENMFGEPETQTIDTTNILFIVSGAFSGIEKIVSSKFEKKNIGFGAENQRMSDAERDNTIDKVCQEDLIKFGMIPEFVGRLQTIAVLHKLDESSMIKILKEPKDSLIKQYQELLNVDGVKLVFDDDAVKKIAHIAIKQKTGARSLRSILEKTMMDIMFTAPTNKKKKITIKAEDVKAENV